MVNPCKKCHIALWGLHITNIIRDLSRIEIDPSFFVLSIHASTVSV